MSRLTVRGEIAVGSDQNKTANLSGAVEKPLHIVHTAGLAMPAWSLACETSCRQEWRASKRAQQKFSLPLVAVPSIHLRRPMLTISVQHRMNGIACFACGHRRLPELTSGPLWKTFAPCLVD